MTPEKAAATASHFLAGGTIATAPVAHATVKLHALKNPEWWENLKDIVRENGRLKGVMASAAAKRARTHCVKGHPLSGDNVEIKRFKGENSRSCKTCRVERHREGFKASPVLKAKAEAHVRAGGLIKDIITTGPKRLFTHSTFLRLKRDDPSFGQLVTMKAPLRTMRWREAMDINRVVLTGRIAAPPDIVFTTIDGLVRKGLPWDIRGDVIGDMCEAVLSGEILLSEAKNHVARFVTKAFAASGWNSLSLDRPLKPDSSVTFLDMLQAPAEEWTLHV